MKLVSVHDLELPTGVLGLAATADGRRAFVTCADGAVCRVDFESGESEAFERRHTSFASGCVLLPDNRTVISAGYDGMLLWHDIETRRCWRRVTAHKFWSWHLALSPDGRRVASCTGQYLPGGWKYEPADEREPSVVVFDAVTGDRLAEFSHVPPVQSCAFSVDGSHLAAANMMGEVRVWNLRSPGDGAPVARWTSPDFTSWGTTKSHHYSGGIHGLAFQPNGDSLLACGMGPMTDPMAGNGRMTWQRWDWREGRMLDQIKEGQHGAGLMETICWHPSGSHFVMGGRQAQGQWNLAVFSAADGERVFFLDTRKRITRAQFTPDGEWLLVSGAIGQPARKDGEWPAWGRVQRYRVEV